MAAAALIISIVAAVVALVSLGWQIFTWQRSRSRVHVRCWFDAEPTGLFVEAYNDGRADAEVREIGFRLRIGGRSVGSDRVWLMYPVRGDPLAFTLRREHGGTWEISPVEIGDVVNTVTHPMHPDPVTVDDDTEISVAAFVVLGTREIVDSRDVATLTRPDLERRCLADLGRDPP